MAISEHREIYVIATVDLVFGQWSIAKDSFETLDDALDYGDTLPHNTHWRVQKITLHPTAKLGLTEA